MERYHIVKNENGRRILVIDEPVKIENEQSLGYEDFDAIFINTANVVYEVNRMAIWYSSPILYNKCWLKTQFVTNRLKLRLRLSDKMVDGYAKSPLDEHFAKAIEEQMERNDRSELPREPHEIKRASDLFLRLCQFALSRGETHYTTGVYNGVAMGYTALNAALFEHQETRYKQERIVFNQTLEELGYARPVRFVERIHLCPKCKHSHLYFSESCPYCKSSNIVQESVIHHFRCANVSPESTYLVNGDLMCPKCKHKLHHIGVDYDRPAAVYTCKECDKQFLHSDMKVTCSNCGHVSTPAELLEHDIMEYEFTPQGVQALVSGDAYYTMEENIFSGYAQFDLFIKSLQINYYSDKKGDEVLVVARFRADEKKVGVLNMLGLSRRVFSHLPFAKLTSRKNELFVMEMSNKKDSAQELIHIEEVTKKELSTVIELNDPKAIEVTNYVMAEPADITFFIKDQDSKESLKW